MRPTVTDLKRLVRAYLEGQARWDEVHQLAIEMEWTSATDFPEPLRKPLEALHMAFLAADEKDDPQFRIDRAEVAKLFEELERAEANSA